MEKKFEVCYSCLGYGWTDFMPLSEVKEFYASSIRGNVTSAFTVWDWNKGKCVFYKRSGSFKPETDEIGLV